MKIEVGKKYFNGWDNEVEILFSTPVSNHIRFVGRVNNSWGQCLMIYHENGALWHDAFPSKDNLISEVISTREEHLQEQADFMRKAKKDDIFLDMESNNPLFVLAFIALGLIFYVGA